MKWLDKFLGASGSGHHRYDEGDEYPNYYDHPTRQSSGGWHGPSIFDRWALKDTNYVSSQDPRRSGEGTSYSNDRPSYPHDRPAYYSDRPPYNSNDTPTYNNERRSHQHDSTTEDTDRAIAMALSEEDHRGGGRPSDGDSDEELARAMQESMNLQYLPTRGGSGVAPIFSPAASRTSGMAVCAGCNQPLGYGRFLSCLGKNWHPNCFCCRLCNKSIADREFSVQGSEAYHRDCYKELFHPKCEVCHNFIPTNSAGLIEYRSHPFWNQKYCPRHERDGTPRCSSCDRIETGGLDKKYASLNDGRRLCLECLETAVLDTNQCQPLYRDILKFYKNLGMMIDQEIPMLLVARSALNAAREGEKEGHTHTAETRGLCLSEEQTITTVFGRKPKAPMGPMFMRTESQKLVRHCEVTAILVLFGLPRLLTGSILAHELMHAWLRLNGGFPNMRPDVEEGICQVMSHIWLSAELKKVALGKSSISTSSSSKQANTAIQARLGEFYLHQIATDSSPIYGDGFRNGIAAVSEFGLVRALEHLRLTGNFP